jgi:hypothetical protein
MIQRRQKPNISQDDIERLLFHLEDTRNYIVRYGAAKDFHSAERGISGNALGAIDDLALQITGNRQYFWQTQATAGGSDKAFQLSVEKKAKRRRLMGIRFPVRFLKFRELLS